MNSFNKANELYKSKEYVKAINAYKECIEIDAYINIGDDLPRCLYNIAVCYIKLEQYTSAIEYLNKALLYRKDSLYYFNLGYCSVALEKFEAALCYFYKSLELNPSDEDTMKTIKFLESKGIKINRLILNVDTDNYSLDILKNEINIALDENNKDLFLELTNKYNKIKSEFIV